MPTVVGLCWSRPLTRSTRCAKGGMGLQRRCRGTCRHAWLCTLVVILACAASCVLADDDDGFAEEVMAGLNAPPRRVTLPRPRAAGGAGYTGSVAYAHDYTFTNPVTAMVAHYSYTTVLPSHVLYADDPESAVLAVDCDWDASGAPAPDALHVEITLDGPAPPASTPLPLSNGSVLLGSAQWGCSPTRDGAAAAFLFEAITTLRLSDGGDDASFTLAGWFVPAPNDVIMNATDLRFFTGPATQFRRLVTTNTFPHAFSSANTTTATRTRRHLAAADCDGSVVPWNAYVSCSLNIDSNVVQLPPPIGANTQIGPFTVVSSKATINAGGTGLTISTSTGLSAVLSARLEMSVVLHVDATSALVSGVQAGVVSGLCFFPVCVSTISLPFSLGTMKAGLMMDLDVPWSITSTVASAFDLTPTASVTGYFDTAAPDSRKLETDFTMSTSDLPAVSGVVSAQLGLRPFLYAGAIFSGSALGASAVVNIKAGVQYTFRLTSTLSFKVPQFPAGSLPDDLEKRTGCSEAHAARLLVTWSGDSAQLRASGGANFRVPVLGTLYDKSFSRELARPCRGLRRCGARCRSLSRARRKRSP